MTDMRAIAALFWFFVSLVAVLLDFAITHHAFVSLIFSAVIGVLVMMIILIITIFDKG